MHYLNALLHRQASFLDLVYAVAGYALNNLTAS
jgi:hypothetical protein